MTTYTSYEANQELKRIQLNNRLVTAREVFTTEFNNRRYYLSAFAETAAKDYGLKDMFQEDRRSFEFALNNHRKRIDSDIALAIDKEGIIKAQLVTITDDKGNGKILPLNRKNQLEIQEFSHKEWLLSKQTTQLFLFDNVLYQLSLAPIKSGSRIIGWIGFGYIIDSNLAVRFAELTDVNVGFLLKSHETWQIIAHSGMTTEVSFTDEFSQQMLLNNNDDYISNQLTLREFDNTKFVAVMFKSKADLLRDIHVNWQRLLLLLALTLVLSLFGAWLIAKGITKPIKLLIKQVQFIAQGNYDESVTIDDSQELAQLATEFNNMKQSVVEREKTIIYRSSHDDLTDLPNRSALLEYLTIRCQQSQPFILLQLKILRLEELNDTLGHVVGDKVIIEVANRLLNCSLVHKSFHLGASNFILVVDQCPIEELINGLLPDLESHYQYENISLHFQYAIGIANSEKHGTKNVAELIQKSHVALQEAQKNKQLFQVYDTQFDTNTIERLHLTNGLHTAIEEGQLVLFYQPKLSLDTMKLSHVEALVRWQHPEKGLVPPDSFISIAEKTGQMDALTRWVTQEAIQQFLSWQKAGTPIKIAINISAENLKDKSYSDFIIALKERYQLPEQAITLEVTEDAVVADPEKATEILCYLKEHGFKLSIDDYGTGYSSLAQLKQLPVQELKIDRSFVQHLMQSQDDQIIVRSTIELAHNMGLSVVAEGIEDEETLLWLKEHKCEIAQGYFISRPLPVNEFDLWLQASPYLNTCTIVEVNEQKIKGKM
ncbi:MAG: EAL domain-containing protein [Colwellia sp.]|nr:EAL domain-containing protein [Colwellia sp.]